MQSSGVLPLIEVLVSDSDPSGELKSPPPESAAVLSVTLLWSETSVPLLKMPPPLPPNPDGSRSTVLSVTSVSSSVRLPWFRIPPPEPSA